MLDAISVLVANELVVAVRTLRIAGQTPADGVRALFDAAAMVLRRWHQGPAFGPDVEAVGLWAESSPARKFVADLTVCHTCLRPLVPPVPASRPGADREPDC